MYRLHYDDLASLANLINEIGPTNRYPMKEPKWSAASLMCIVAGDGSHMYVCDMTIPHWPTEALKDLAHVIHWKWS